MQKLTLLSSPGKYEGSESDCILLATNGNIQAISAGSPNVNINLHTVQKVDEGKGKMIGEQPCPIKYHYNIYYISISMYICIIYQAGLGIRSSVF